MNINEAAWIQSSWMLNIKFQIAIFQKPLKIIWCGFRQSPPYWSALKYLVELKPLYLPFLNRTLQCICFIFLAPLTCFVVDILIGQHLIGQPINSHSTCARPFSSFQILFEVIYFLRNLQNYFSKVEIKVYKANIQPCVHIFWFKHDGKTHGWKIIWCESDEAEYRQVQFIRMPLSLNY